MLSISLCLRDPFALSLSGQEGPRRQTRKETQGVDEYRASPCSAGVGGENSFAHIDERLDQLLEANATDEIVQIHLARTLPTAKLVLKRFNPSTLTLSYLDQEANLALCAEEVRTIRAAVLDLTGRERSEISLLGQAESPTSVKARDA